MHVLAPEMSSLELSINLFHIKQIHINGNSDIQYCTKRMEMLSSKNSKTESKYSKTVLN